MKKEITESIFDNGSVIIPMADVSHVEYLKLPEYKAKNGLSKPTGLSIPNGIMVITKHTKWDMEADTWSNAIFIPEEKKQDFISSWCRYRSESECLMNWDKTSIA